MSRLLGMKDDERPPKGGWAPGDYANTCFVCGALFLGDKRGVLLR